MANRITDEAPTIPITNTVLVRACNAVNYNMVGPGWYLGDMNEKQMHRQVMKPYIFCIDGTHTKMRLQCCWQTCFGLGHSINLTSCSMLCTAQAEVRPQWNISHWNMSHMCLVTWKYPVGAEAELCSRFRRCSIFSSSVISPLCCWEVLGSCKQN